MLRSRRLHACLGVGFVTAVLSSCGGGTGSDQDSGVNKTTLRVEASDADGDALQYQWRVTGGRIDNRNSNETVWTMPDGPGLHFAYVMVSDGKGGYAEQQYAVATDALRTEAPQRPALDYAPRSFAPGDDFLGNASRLRFRWRDEPGFAAGAASAPRMIYLPDVIAQVVDGADNVVFNGVSDTAGEISLPKLRNGTSYRVRCATGPDQPLLDCGPVPTTDGTARLGEPRLPLAGADARNLRLYGHFGFADGGVCGTQSDFFAVQSAATVQLQAPDGTPLGPTLRVNRFGDYALDAAVAVDASLRLALQCGSYRQVLEVPAGGAGGYVASRPVELSRTIPNSRPRIVKMVANGPDGNVRGRMIVTEANAQSNGLPGADQFLVYKGKDTPLSACMYYRSIGAVQACDAQGGMTGAITLADWERRHKFKPNDNGNVEVSAKYINKMDLNLVRFMRATSTAPDNIAFVVCNHPGPDGQTQAEVDQVMATALAAEREVACVAMEWSTSPNVNNGQPFTKFLTFGPDGTLLPSVNLDGRGEKYMPGTCVACHGGTQYNGRFPDKGDPSPFLGSRFLAFDTGNYLFSSDPALGEAAQSDAIHALNQHVFATEGAASTPTKRLIEGWYPPGGGTMLRKDYVPTVWANDTTTDNPGLFYREVVGSVCRTCHVAMGPSFDWDSTVLTPDFREGSVKRHVCGGTSDIARNASMPNALISRDRIADRVRAEPALGPLMQAYLGCSAPLPDPAYPKR